MIKFIKQFAVHAFALAILAFGFAGYSLYQPALAAEPVDEPSLVVSPIGNVVWANLCPENLAACFEAGISRMFSVEELMISAFDPYDFPEANAIASSTGHMPIEVFSNNSEDQTGYLIAHVLDDLPPATNGEVYFGVRRPIETGIPEDVMYKTIGSATKADNNEFPIDDYPYPFYEPWKFIIPADTDFADWVSSTSYKEFFIADREINGLGSIFQEGVIWSATDSVDDNITISEFIPEPSAVLKVEEPLGPIIWGNDHTIRFSTVAMANKRIDVVLVSMEAGRENIDIHTIKAAYDTGTNEKHLVSWFADLRADYCSYAYTAMAIEFRDSETSALITSTGKFNTVMPLKFNLPVGGTCMPDATPIEYQSNTLMAGSVSQDILSGGAGSEDRGIFFWNPNPIDGIPRWERIVEKNEFTYRDNGHTMEFSWLIPRVQESYETRLMFAFAFPDNSPIDPETVDMFATTVPITILSSELEGTYLSSLVGFDFEDAPAPLTSLGVFDADDNLDFLTEGSIKYEVAFYGGAENMIGTWLEVQKTHDFSSSFGDISNIRFVQFRVTMQSDPNALILPRVYAMRLGYQVFEPEGTQTIATIFFDSSSVRPTTVERGSAVTFPMEVAMWPSGTENDHIMTVNVDITGDDTNGITWSSLPVNIPANTTITPFNVTIGTDGETLIGDYGFTVSGYFDGDPNLLAEPITGTFTVAEVSVSQSFTLSLDAISKDVVAGTSVEYLVTINRVAGFVEEIEFGTPDGWPAGWNSHFDPNATPDNETTLTIVVPTEATPGAISFRIVGTVITPGENEFNFIDATLNVSAWDTKLTPEIAAVIPTSGLNTVTHIVEITGINFGNELGWVRIGEDNIFVSTWSDTYIIVIVPPKELTENLTLPVTVIRSNGELDRYFSYTYTVAGQTAPPIIDRISPVEGHKDVITTVTINGSGFGTRENPNGGVFVEGDSNRAKVLTWVDNEIVFEVPADPNLTEDTPKIIKVIRSGDGTEAEYSSFTHLFEIPVLELVVENIFPASGFANVINDVTITGENFGDSGSVEIGVASADIVSWSNTSIDIRVPIDSTVFQDTPKTVKITREDGMFIEVSGGYMHVAPEIVITQPSITGISPEGGDASESHPVVIAGSNFGDSIGLVSIGGVTMTVTPGSWSDSSITITVPADLTITETITKEVRVVRSDDEYDTHDGYTYTVAGDLGAITLNVVVPIEEDTNNYRTNTPTFFLRIYEGFQRITFTDITFWTGSNRTTPVAVEIPADVLSTSVEYTPLVRTDRHLWGEMTKFTPQTGELEYDVELVDERLLIGDLYLDGEYNGGIWGIIGDFDLSVLLNAFTNIGNNLREDLNNDGVVGSFDLSFIIVNWGKQFQWFQL